MFKLTYWIPRCKKIWSRIFYEKKYVCIWNTYLQEFHQIKLIKQEFFIQLNTHINMKLNYKLLNMRLLTKNFNKSIITIQLKCYMCNAMLHICKNFHQMKLNKQTYFIQLKTDINIKLNYKWYNIKPPTENLNKSKMIIQPNEWL